MVVPKKSFVLALIIFLLSSPGYASLSGKKIGIDPGHGGSDPGAVGCVEEEDFTLATSLKLRTYCQNDSAGVVMTRTGDSSITITNRVSIFNSNNVSISIAIHNNAAGSTAHGVETYYCSQNSSPSSSKTLATKILNRLLKEVKNDSRGVKECLAAGRGFHFGMVRSPTNPATLPETYFVSNPTECSGIIKPDAGRDKCAHAMYNAICDYYGVAPKGTAVPVPAVPATFSVLYKENGYGVVLKWAAVSGATKYKVGRRPSGGTWTYWDNLTTANEPAIGWPAMYHTPGVGKFDFAVQAGNASGYSAWKYVNAVIVNDQSAPATPAGLTAQVVNGNSVKLTWTAVAGASGYTIYCSSTAAEVNDACYKKTPTGDGQTWTGLAYITDGLRDNTNYGSSAVAAQANAWITFSPAVELHKYNFRLFDGDNRIYENVYARWYDTAGAYHNPHDWRSYRTGGAYRLSATTDVKCTKLGLSFASSAGNTINAQNHVTVMEAHGGYRAKVTGATTYTATGLLGNTVYYFRIDAYRTTVPETISFSCPVVSTRTPASSDVTPPGAPTLSSPSNGLIVKTALPSFDWSDVSDPSGVKYEVMADNTNDFASPVFNQQSLAASLYKPTVSMTNGMYYWRARAVDNAGNTGAWSTTFNFTVTVDSSDVTAPTNPTTASAWPDQNKSKVITNNTWQNVDAGPYFELTGATDAGSGIDGYSIYWGADATEDPGTTANKDHAVPVSYFASAAVSETPYYLRVRTVDNTGNWSDAVTLFTYKYDNTFPLVPEPVYPDKSKMFSVRRPTFTWTAVSDTSGVTYLLQADNDTTFVSPELNITGITSNEYAAVTDMADGKYYWRTASKDGAGNVSNWSRIWIFNIDTLGPAAVNTLTAVSESGGDIKLSWTAVIDSVGTVGYYKIYRSQVQGSLGAQINTGAEDLLTEYIDPGTGLIDNATYYYTVEPVDNAGNATVTGNNQASAACQKWGISIAGLKVNPQVFSPNYDEILDSATITCTINPGGVMTVKVYDGDTVVRTLMADQQMNAGVVTVVWDGAGDNEKELSESKAYSIQITGKDDQGRISGPRKVDVIVDLTAPNVVSITAAPTPISPNNDGTRDTASIIYCVEEDVFVNLGIYDSSGTLVKTLLTDSLMKAGTAYTVWDGKDENGGVTEGEYIARVGITDLSGNMGLEEETGIAVELTSGWIMGYIYDATSGLGNIVSNRIGNGICTISTGKSITSSSDAAQKGFYGFYSLPEGEYLVSVYASKYELTTTTIVVTTGKITWASIGLKYTGICDEVAPVLQHVPITVVGLAGQKIRIASIVTDNYVVADTKVEYKTVSAGNLEGELKELGMVASGDNYIADIPASEIDTTVEQVWYRIVAMDNDGNITYAPTKDTWNVIQRRNYGQNTISSSGGRVYIPDANPDDGQVELRIAAGTVNDSVIRVTQQDAGKLSSVKDKTFIEGDVDKPVAAYEVTAAVTALDSPAELTLIYFDLDDDGIVDGTEINESALQIFWFDGNDWRYVGGTVNTAMNTVSTKVSHFTSFGLFPVSADMANLQAIMYKPKERIVTPNSDGRNDFACFNGINNYWAALTLRGNDTAPREVKVFDVKNKLVRVINEGDIWDGKDENGDMVENGIYIYQYEVNSKVVNGTVVVAK
ncbi:MAG: N-acetylmuramoyl-L-alanine amidase [Elusimicrobiota bacterium]